MIVSTLNTEPVTHKLESVNVTLISWVMIALNPTTNAPTTVQETEIATTPLEIANVSQDSMILTAAKNLAQTTALLTEHATQLLDNVLAKVAGVEMTVVFKTVVLALMIVQITVNATLQANNVFAILDTTETIAHNNNNQLIMNIQLIY